MASTRGIKFKFSQGGKVFCYEPDPTKAKVLYESKVLDVVVGHDNHGRRVPEYLIHFFGWNTRWDRRVKEEFILPFTEENGDLQIMLAKDAALTLKGKRKKKLPPLIKKTLAKTLCSDGEKKEVKQADNSLAYTSSESSEDEMERDVQISIPEVLMRVLDEDLHYITQKNKLVKIPCEKNVISILESYVKHRAADLLRAIPPKNGKQIIPEDVKNKLNLCEEAMDSLRVYIDFILPRLLLYEQEVKQCYIIGTICHPAGYIPSEESKQNADIDTPKNDFVSKDETVFPNKRKEEPISPTKEQSVFPTKKMALRPRGKPSLCMKVKKGKTVNRLAPYKRNNSPQPSKNVVKDSAKKIKSTRVLRSTLKQEAGMDVSVSDSPLKSELLQKVDSWHMLPRYLYQRVPAAFSLIYGAQHLLRLFVKLPVLLSKMGIPKKNLVLIINILENFLLFLAEQKDELFPANAYVDSSEVFPDMNSHNQIK